MLHNFLHILCSDSRNLSKSEVCAMPMDMGFYMRDPKLWEYFISLPSPVRAALVHHRVYVSTLGELQMMADHFRQELGVE